MLGDNSECDPPESISNSEVKPLSANDSVGFPHVKVDIARRHIRKGFINIKPFLLRKNCVSLRNPLQSTQFCWCSSVGRAADL